MESDRELTSNNLPLAGKTAFVTGGNRDIGAGTIRALARLGISRVGSIHRDERKAKREPDVVNYAAAHGTDVKFTLGDITTPEGIQTIANMTNTELGGNLDILVLNTSGQGRDVNVVAANAIVDALLPKMNPGGTIMFRQSVPGHYYEELRQQGREGEIPEFYRGIAEVKGEGEKTLRARIPEFNAKGIRFLVDCPPEVAGTGNIRLFTRFDRSFSEKHRALLASLGLPHIIPIEAVAHVSSQMLANSNLPTGYIELYRETRDVRGPLSRFYTDRTTYADQVNDRYNFATFTVPETHTDRSNEPANIEAIEFTQEGAVATTHITKAHAKDHFRDEVGLNPLPLHKQVRTVVEVAGAIVNNGSDSPKRVRLSSFDGIQCMGAIIPGTTMETRITVTDRNDTSMTFDVQISRDGKPVTSMQQVTCIVEDAPSLEQELREKFLLEDQIIETAAQMAGMLSWNANQGQDFSPLFLSVGSGRFFERAKAGDILTGLINTRPTRRGSDSDVLMITDGRELADIRRINSIVVRTNVVRRILGI
ncbi:SDR family NAD(P)-dependent oxidoreductase [Candidatus Daviesbacteria bacterium]|nr:SDR family NAD(P)-dependent oxidoreductase [Candidatus Daviesbacteria bacterium]